MNTDDAAEMTMPATITQAKPESVSPPNIASGKLGDASLANAGFTKYQRMSDGTYQRQAGNAGPKHVDPQQFRGALGE